MKYLFRKTSNSFEEKIGEPVDELGPLRPWALTNDNRIVFAPWDLREAATGPLRHYNQAISQIRRRQFESYLARDAGDHIECVKPALDAVTFGIKKYFFERAGAQGKDIGEIRKAAGAAVQQRCYGDTASGRLGLASQKPKDELSAWEEAEKALSGRDIPKIIGIQTAIANFLSRTLGYNDSQKKIYIDTQVRVAPSAITNGHLYEWFDSPQNTPLDGERRGRQKRGGKPAPTTAPGVINPGATINDPDKEARERGIDVWERNSTPSNFLKGLDDRNLYFGAGRSGTTGELLKTYRTFGGQDVDEGLKQYLLACVVYLVGGGHHSCHEIFSVANLLSPGGGPEKPEQDLTVGRLKQVIKGNYVPGKYLRHLPRSYLTTPHWLTLKEQYWDIAVLGHLHGAFVGLH